MVYILQKIIKTVLTSLIQLPTIVQKAIIINSYEYIHPLVLPCLY